MVARLLRILSKTTTVAPRAAVLSCAALLAIGTFVPRPLLA